jgi:hypothetical protein
VFGCWPINVTPQPIAPRGFTVVVDLLPIALSTGVVGTHRIETMGTAVDVHVA